MENKKLSGRNQRKLRNFLLQPLVQVRLGLYSILLTFVFLGILGFMFYQTVVGFIAALSAVGRDQGEMGQLFYDYAMASGIWIVFVMFLFVLVSLVVSVVYTHRLVGPTVAFRRHIASLRAGDYSARVRLRKGDAFNEVADALNDLAAHLESQSH